MADDDKGAQRRSGPSQEQFVRDYRKEQYAKPSVTVDLVVFTVADTDLKVLLIRRKQYPFRGRWALPGGFVDVGDGYEDQGESLEEAAHRELAEETGLPVGSVFLEQLYTFGKSYRDPRMRIISVAYYALVRPDRMPIVAAGSDAEETRWWSLREVPQLAFDHAGILDTALERIRGKLDYTPLGFELVPQAFTIAELRAVYEAIKGEVYDAGNFRRRFHRLLQDGVIEQAPGKRQTQTKPANVYRFLRRGDSSRG